MKIDRFSWHCRVASFLYPHGDMPKTACTYFWAFLFVTLGAPILITACSAFVVGAVLLVSCIVLAQLYGWMLPLHPFWMAFGVIGLTVLGLAVSVLIVIGINYIWHKVGNSIEPGSSADIVGSWITAKHRKICPLIEYK